MEKNKAWILIRGLTRASFHWLDFSEQIKLKFPEYEIIVVDLPGNGLRNNENSFISIDSYVEDLRKKLSQISTYQELNVLALSLGAMVLLAWIEKYPSEINNAFLVNTSSKGLTSFYERLLPQNYINIVQSLVNDEVMREKLVLKMTSNNLEKQEKYLKYFVEMARKYPIKKSNFLKQLVAAANFKIKNKPKNTNLKLFISQNDRLVSFKNSIKLAEKWDLKTFIHPWAGHDLVLDDPDFVLDHLNL